MLKQLFDSKIVGLKNLAVGLSGSALLLAMAGVLGAAPSLAAEKINLVFGNDTTSGVEVPIADLRSFAETKQPTPQLKSILEAATPEQQAEFLKVLQTSYPADPVELAKLLDSDQGKKMLTAVATATLRPNQQGMDAVKAALIDSAKSPKGFSILGFLEAYPDPTFNIDLLKTQQLVAANQELINASKPQLEKVVKSPSTQTSPGTTEAPAVSPQPTGEQTMPSGTTPPTMNQGTEAPTTTTPIAPATETQPPVSQPQAPTR
ncbi:MAG: alpha/beta hydrolase [Aphanocapsa sp. GSE-SYN-MK-11-07L]|jgi:hypothetical protein|nr:alpha/beta hydrolase [Aphanocapsa sp. GSE-SYN-MK-11-07L]